MSLWLKVLAQLVKVKARDCRDFFYFRGGALLWFLLLSICVVVSFSLFSITTVAWAEEQKTSNSGLNTLIQKGEDPRISRKIPEGKIPQVISVPVVREVPVPTQPRHIRLKNQEAVVYPNIRMHPSSTTTQSEMSIWTHPINPDVALVGSNAAHTSIAVVSQGWYYTTDGGMSWSGADTLPTHTNLGLYMSDPAVGVDVDGNLFFNALLYGGGSGDVIIARSTNNGNSWSQTTVPSPSIDEDKNHLAVDINPGSPFENNLYTGYTDFAPFPSPVMFSRSTNRGVSFTSPVPISGSIGSQFAQGINLAVGADGELYAAWSGYDSWPPPVTTRLGFNKSTDGGATWQTAASIGTVNDIRGSLNKGGNLVRVNSFPSMAVDRSTGPRQGWIYIVYPEKNSTTPDIFLVRSTDAGSSWSSPVKVNQDNSGKDQWFAWITVDPTTGALYVTYYDSRNFPANDSAQVYISSSLDGGITFEPDVLVSDVAFLPSPIPGLAGGYMGDYIGISAVHGVVWPCWNDNRTGIHQAYTSRIEFIEVDSPPKISVSPETLNFGEVFLGYPETLSVNVRNLGFPETLSVTNIQSDSTDFTPETTFFALPGGSSRNVKVAFSPSTSTLITGTLTITSSDTANPTVPVILQGIGLIPPDISVTPESLSADLFTGEMETETLTIANAGFSDLNFDISIEGVTAVPGLKFTTQTKIEKGTNYISRREEYHTHIKNEKIVDPYRSIEKKSMSDTFSDETRTRYGTFIPRTSSSFGERLFGAISNQISEIDLNTGFVIQSFPTPVPTSDGPTALAFSGTLLYFTDAFQTSKIFVLDQGIGTVLDSFPAPSFSIDGLAFVNGKLYAMDYGASKIYELNPDDGTVLRMISPPVSIIGGIDGGNGRLFASNFSSAIYELSLVDGSVINSFVPVTTVYGLGFTGTRLFASVPGIGIDEYDPNTGTYLGRISSIGFAALAGGGISWLLVNPDTGTVPAGNSMDIAVTFDATGLNGGDYFANILISSNDPDEPQDTTPVHLHVTGAPDIAISDDTLDYGSVFIGGSVTETLVVSNVGTDSLKVSSITSDNPNYTVNITNFNLDPGEKQNVLVTFTPPDTGLFTGNLTIISNDPDEDTVVVSLRGIGLLPPDISVTPDSLSADLFTGEMVSETLRIFNTGFSPLIFNISEQSVPGAFLQSRSSSMSQVSSFPKAKLPYTSFNKSVAIDSSIRILTIDFGYPQSYWLLDSLKVPYTLVNTSQFDTINLTNYDLFYVGTLGSDFQVQVLINRKADIAAFLQSGGGIVALYEGAFNAWQWLPVSVVQNVGLCGENVHIVDTTHPAMESLTDAGLSNWSCSYHGVFTSYDSSLQPLAVGVDAGNLPVILAGEYFGGRLYITGTDNEGHMYRHETITMVGKAIEWAGGLGWLNENPLSGAIPAGDSMDIEVTFDAASLNGGDYYANILVSSNDPDEPQDTTPVHLHVTGAPDIAVSDTIFDYDSVFIGASVTETLIVSNVGTDSLKVSAISSDNPAYSVDITNFNLNPGEKQNVLVTFTPPDTGLFTGNLTIASNDPDEDTVVVVLRGQGILPPDISVTPESLSADLFTGEMVTETLTISNTGFSDLNFEISIEGTLQTASVASKLRKVQGSQARSAGSFNGLLEGEIMEPDSLGDIISSFLSPDALPTGLAFDGTNLWHSGHYSATAYELTTAGDLLSTFSLPGTYAFDLEWDGTHLWFARYNVGIYKLTTNGTVVGFFPFTNGPEGVAWDGSHVWFSAIQTDTIYRMTPNGEIVSSFPAPSPFIAGLAWDGSSLWAASQYGGIYQMSPTGEILNAFSTGFQNMGCTFDGKYLWVADYSSRNIYQIDIEHAPAFVSVNPSSGTVPAGSSMEIEVIFDATGLIGGDYYANILISSNDPDEPQDTTPVHLHVTGAPDIAVSPDTLDYGSLFIGASVTETVVVSNEGTDLLTVSDITPENPNYTVNITNFSLNPGDKQKVLVTFTPSDTGLITGHLTVESNDPDEDTVMVLLNGTGLLPPDISVSPASLETNLFKGGKKTETLTISNTGFSDLNFDISIEEVAVGLRFTTKAEIVAKTINHPRGHREGHSEIKNEKLIDPYGEKVKGNISGTFSSNAKTPFNTLISQIAQSSGGRLFGAISNQISEIDLNTGLVIHSFPTPVPTSDGPTALAFSGMRLYYTDAFVTSKIFVLDPGLGTILDSFPAPSFSIDGLAFVDGKLYAMDYNVDNIYELNPDDGTVLRTISPPVFIGGGVDGGNGRLFASNFESAIYELSLADGSVINSFAPVTTVYGLGFTGTRLFASVPGVGIDEYDPNTGTYLGRISPLGFAALAGSGTSWLLVNPDSGTVPAGNSMDIEVTFDATDLDVGYYYNVLMISSDDPDESLWIVVATMKVVNCLAGDLNGDESVTLPDLIFLVNYIFRGGPRADCRGNVNADNKINLTDVVYLVNYLFRQGPEPNPGCCAP